MTSAPLLFNELKSNLDQWAEFTPDSPVARYIQPTLRKSTGKKLTVAQEADLLCLLSAVYQAGCEWGQNRYSSVRYATLHIVHETIDEHGRHGGLIGIFTDHLRADQAAEGRGWFGGKADVQKANGYFVGDRIMFPTINIAASDLDVDLPKSRESRRVVALAKLTADERELLGLDNE